MNRICRIIGFLLSFFPIFLVSKLKSACDYIRTGYLSRYVGIEERVKIRKGCHITGYKHIVIECDTIIGRYCSLTAWPNSQECVDRMIRIGKRCSIGDFAHITSSNHIDIGDGVLLGKFVTITDNSHGKGTLEETNTQPNKRKVYSKGPVIIGDHVWIGDKVTILPGVSIGKGAIIGANSVVTNDVPSYCVAAGIPARIIKQLN